MCSQHTHTLQSSFTRRLVIVHLSAYGESRALGSCRGEGRAVEKSETFEWRAAAWQLVTASLAVRCGEYLPALPAHP
jgi:hypothetical protein